MLLPRQRLKLARGAKDKEHAMPETAHNAIAAVGVDIGKNSFHVVGLDQRGAIVLRQKWSRGQVEARFANLPPCWSAWRPASARIISVVGLRRLVTMPV